MSNCVRWSGIGSGRWFDGQILKLIPVRSGYNPPKFAIDAAKDALDRVECNQYSPTKVNIRKTIGYTRNPAHYL